MMIASDFRFLILVLFLFSPMISLAQPRIHKEPVEASLIDHVKDTNPDADLFRFPMFRYKVDVDLGSVLRVGDTISSLLWDTPLWVVNHEMHLDTIYLRSYQKKPLIVLDFWASWCKPCVYSMDKWEKYIDSLTDVALVGVHIDFDYKALPVIRKRGWQSPSVIGEAARLLNHIFFNKPTVSRLVWISQGRIIAITGTEGHDLDLIKQVIAGQDVEIPMQLEGTY